MRATAVRPQRPAAIVAIVAIAGVAAFLVLAAAAAWFTPILFDAPLIAAVQGLPVPTDAWRAFTTAGDSVFLFPMGTGLVLWLLWRRRPRDAALVAVALIGASLFTEVVKELIARPRPPGPHLTPASGYSFPSGHALNSTAGYGLVALHALRSRLPHPGRLLGVAILATMPVLVGLSRVALGVHYPSDVLGGWLAGIAIVAAVAAVTATARSEDRA